MKFSKAAPAQVHLSLSNLNWLEEFFIKKRSIDDGLNVRMFKEDFPNIFRNPYRGSGKHFDIETNNQALTNQFLGGIQTKPKSFSFDERLIKLIEDIATSLIWYGKAFYFLTGEDSERQFVSLNPQNIFKVGGFIFQYLPRRVVENLGYDNFDLRREMRFLPSEKTLSFSWPISIHRKISSQNRVLATLDRHNLAVAAGFQVLPTHENPSPRNDFNFKQWRDAQDLAIYKSTRQTGWNARKYHDQKRSDFFDCYRLIRFRRTQLALRDHILQRLGDEVTKVGQVYASDFWLRISAASGLASVEQLIELEARLSREEIGFSEVIDRCFKS